MPNKLANKFIFSHSGDSSVGIDGDSATVEYSGEFWNQDDQSEFVQTLKASFEELWGFRVTVIFEHEHTCAGCSKVVAHLDDWCDMPFYCSNQPCLNLQMQRAEDEIAEQEKAQEDAWSWLSKEDQEDIINGSLDVDPDYFRDRNARTLRSINGAGVRA